MTEQQLRAVGVLTVDDQAVFRRAVQDVVELTDGFETLGEAASGPEAIQLAADAGPQLVLVDIRMPGMNGVDTARELRARHPDAVIVLITNDDLADVPGGASCCGATAVMRKKDFGSAALQDVWRAYGPGLTPEPVQDE